MSKEKDEMSLSDTPQGYKGEFSDALMALATGAEYEAEMALNRQDKVPSQPVDGTVDNRQSKPYYPQGVVLPPSSYPSSCSSGQQRGRETPSSMEAEQRAEEFAVDLIRAAQTATPSRTALDFPTWGGGVSQPTRPTPSLYVERPRRKKRGEVLRAPAVIGGDLGWVEDADGRRRLAAKNPGALHWSDWGTWLKVAAYRWLNTAFAAGRISSTVDHHLGHDGPTAEVLRQAFAEILQRHGQKVDHYEVGMGNLSPEGFKDDDEIDRLARGTAEHVVENWKSDYIAQRVDWGRRGGKASRRGPVAYTAFLNLPAGLSQQQAADALGLHVKTIRNYEKRQRAER